MTGSIQYEKPLASRRIRAVSLYLYFLSFIGFCVICGPAWSFQTESHDTHLSQEDVKTVHPLITKSSPTIQKDGNNCSSLLKTIQHNNYRSQSMDRNRRAAGKAAALSLVFGVRFALGPKEISRHKSDHDVKIDVWKAEDHSGVQALAVADYRRCKNEQALQALSDFRWER